MTTYKVGDRVQGEWGNETFTGTIQYLRNGAAGRLSVLIGWKVGEKLLECAWDARSAGGEQYMQPGYIYGYWMPISYLKGTSTSASVSQGMKCTRCGEFNSYAEPNQPDSTYKCYTCRQHH